MMSPDFAALHPGYSLHLLLVYVLIINTFRRYVLDQSNHRGRLKSVDVSFYRLDRIFFESWQPTQ